MEERNDLRLKLAESENIIKSLKLKIKKLQGVDTIHPESELKRRELSQRKSLDPRKKLRLSPVPDPRKVTIVSYFDVRK